MSGVLKEALRLIAVMCHTGKVQIERRLSRSRTVHLVDINDQCYLIIYDRRRRRVVKIVPAGAAS